MGNVVFFVCRMLLLLFVSGIFLFIGWVGVVVVVVVGVVSMCMFGCVVFSGLCFLDVGSLYVSCVGFHASDLGSWRSRLGVVGGGGCGVLMVLFFSLIR